MKIRKIKCPHCEEVVEIDFDVGLEQDCPECGEEISINPKKVVRRNRRSGIKVGDEYHGTGSRQPGEDDPIEEKWTGIPVKGSKRGSSEHIEEDSVPDENHGDIKTASVRKKKLRTRHLVMGGLLILNTGFVLYAVLYLKKINDENKAKPLPDRLYSTDFQTPLSKSAYDQVSTSYERPQPPASLGNPQNTQNIPMTGQGRPINSDARSAIAAKLLELGVPEKASERGKLARETATRYLEAKNLEERLPLIRNIDQLGPAITEYYNKNGEPGPTRYTEIKFMTTERDDPRFLALEIKMADGSSKVMGLEFTKEGYKIDWPSFVIYSEMEWQEFMEAKPETDKRFRLFATPGNYFNYGYTEEEYACYQLENPLGHDRAIYGYVEKNTGTHNQIEELVQQAPGQALPLVLNIRFPKNAKTDNIVDIRKFISNGWMLREEQEVVIDKALRGDI